MEYRVAYKSMHNKAESIITDNIDKIEEFSISKGYKSFSRNDVMEALENGYNFEMWFPFSYDKIVIEIMTPSKNGGYRPMTVAERVGAEHRMFCREAFDEEEE